jgi:hypothetical protein
MLAAGCIDRQRAEKHCIKNGAGITSLSIKGHVYEFCFPIHPCLLINISSASGFSLSAHNNACPRRYMQPARKARPRQYVRGMATSECFFPPRLRLGEPVFYDWQDLNELRNFSQLACLFPKHFHIQVQQEGCICIEALAQAIHCQVSQDTERCMKAGKDRVQDRSPYNVLN